jgi:GH15 family glucan-1,4-alpha-glucosidase
MAGLIEDYALIGNCETAALVGRDGSIDWLCLPRFDSAACFAGLLGDERNGRWRLGPAGPASVSRRYRDGTLVLETTFETDDGAVVLTDCMSWRDGATDLVRQVKGLRGRVAMSMNLVVRFDYGASVPWVSRDEDGRVKFVAGPNSLVLQCGRDVENRDMQTIAEFEVAERDVVDFVLTWSVSYRAIPQPLNAAVVIEATTARWAAWVQRFSGAGDYSDIVLRSLITLKALTHFETGGIVAAATTSLPEQLGGPRNWDYRFCWLRDATLTLYALMECNFVEEAVAWRQWLIRAVAGSPEQLQIMYGIAGERRLDEWNIPWLPGYENSAPVHVGNAAAGQVQLDVYGEVMDALYFGRTKGMPSDNTAWDLEQSLIAHLQKIWQEPDDGLWEQRGGRRQFTHSKIMAWVAIDRAIRSAEEFGLAAPLAEWRGLRRDIHADVCANGFDAGLSSFVQTYGSKNLDAALLMIPLVGFLPITDPRVTGTVAAIEDRLLVDGFVMRYDNVAADDGLPGREGAFLACSFWLADNYVLQGRISEARALFERLVGLCNDVGLLAEEYDPRSKRQVGNFPQAFSHLGLINTAFNLSRVAGPAAERAAGGEAHAA